MVCAVVLGSAARADTVAQIMPLGNAPKAMGINPVTNRIYVANDLDGTVSVVDATGGRTETVTVGNRPRAIAVNPVTNRVYVANLIDGTITVIDGQDLTTDTISLGASSPTVLAMNPATNRLYVAVSGGEVLVIDGDDHSIETIATGGGTNLAMALDVGRNKIYVTQNNNQTVIIDGTDHTFSVRPVGRLPGAIATNPVSGKTYTANLFDNDFSRFSCTEAFSSFTTGSGPTDVTVDPVRNVIRIANETDSVTFWAPNHSSTPSTFPVGDFPQAIVSNHRTGKHYIHCTGDATVWSYDSTTEVLPVPVGVGVFAVNPLTNRIYFASQVTGELAVIDGRGQNDLFLPPNPPANDQDVHVINPLTGTYAAISRDLDNVYLVPRFGSSVSYSVALGDDVAMAVSPAQGLFYVASFDGGVLQLTKIDEADSSTETVTLGSVSPEELAVAVHPLSEKVYVIAKDTGRVFVVDGLGNPTVVLSLSPMIRSVQVDVEKNRIYAAEDDGSPSLFVVDGISDTIQAIVPVGGSPSAIEVGVASDRIFVANESDDTVTVVDRTNLTTQTVSVGDGPSDLVVAPFTNEVFVANHGDDTVTVLNAANLATVSTIGPLPNPLDPGDTLVFDSASNTVYADRNGIDVIDKFVRAMREKVLFTDPEGHRNYAHEFRNGSYFGVILMDHVFSDGHYAVNIPPVSGDVSTTDRPSFLLGATAGGGAADPLRTQIYYQLETWMGEWTAAPQGRSATIQLPPLSPGLHVLHAFSADGQHWTGSSHPTPFLGEVFSYAFVVRDCAAGNVNRGTTGISESVLSINGSDGGSDRTVIVGAGEPVTVALAASQSGPATNAKYVFWTWPGRISGGTGIPLLSRTELLGCFVYPSPLHTGFGPQPLFCVRSTGLPNALCRMTQEKPGPPRAPFSITNASGIGNPIKLTMQGLLQDSGSEGTIAFSVTNAVVLCVE